MGAPSQKIYRSWPTYQQANTDGSDIAQSREWNYSLFDCCSPGTLCLKSTFLPCLTYGKTQSRSKDPNLSNFSYINSPVPFSGSCKLSPEAKCEKNMVLKDPVVGIAVYQFGVAAVLWFKKRKRWNSEPDLSLLATRIRARWPIHKALFIPEVSATAQDRPGDSVTV
ncbi:hypothetical protein N7465_005842 [Penicillium sp. CMV-2018d]|nr:hypothetical protein N7465_005842 [Penicillium sp. CMV-2018d]